MDVHGPRDSSLGPRAPLCLSEDIMKQRANKIDAWLGGMSVALASAILSGCGLAYVGIPSETDDGGAEVGRMVAVLPREAGTRPPREAGLHGEDARLPEPDAGLESGVDGSHTDAGPPVDSGHILDSAPHEDAAEDAPALFDAGDDATEDADIFDAGGGLCEGYAPPDVFAGCEACFDEACQANGCFGGYWCNTETDRCHEFPPFGCGDD
jgi:hypothetical protein